MLNTENDFLYELGKKYQKTGIYPAKAVKAEYDYVMENSDKLLKDYIRYAINDMSFRDYIGIQIGLWQIKYGFYRSYNGKTERLQRLTRKIHR